LTRSGFVALAGRPNVGKSTLVNLIVGEKVAIVSDRAQTTRRAIRGVHRSGRQRLCGTGFGRGHELARGTGGLERHDLGARRFAGR